MKMKSYYKPTPAKWRKLGDALLAAATTGATFAIANDHQWVGLTLMLVGSIGKFLTNFFTEE